MDRQPVNTGYRGRNYDPHYHNRKPRTPPRLNTAPSSPPYDSKRRRQNSYSTNDSRANNYRNLNPSHSRPISPTTPTQIYHDNVQAPSYSHINYRRRSLTPVLQPTPESSPGAYWPPITADPDRDRDYRKEWSPRKEYNSNYNSNKGDWDRRTMDRANQEKPLPAPRPSKDITPRSRNDDATKPNPKVNTNTGTTSHRAAADHQTKATLTAPTTTTKSAGSDITKTIPRAVSNTNANMTQAPPPRNSPTATSTVSAPISQSSEERSVVPPTTTATTTTTRAPTPSAASKVSHDTPGQSMAPLKSTSTPSPGVQAGNVQVEAALPVWHLENSTSTTTTVGQTADQNSHVTLEANLKLIDLHLENLKRSSKSLQDQHALAVNEKRRKDSSNLLDAILIINAEIQCYSTLRHRLHWAQDPVMQRNIILTVNDRIMSAEKLDIFDMLPHLEDLLKPLSVLTSSSPPPISTADISQTVLESTALNSVSQLRNDENYSRPIVPAKRKALDEEPARENDTGKPQQLNEPTSKPMDQAAASATDINPVLNEFKEVKVKSEVESGSGSSGSSNLTMALMTNEVSSMVAAAAPVSLPHSEASPEHQVSVMPMTEQLVIKQPVIEQPAIKQPAIELSEPEQLANEQPTTDQPSIMQTTIEQSVTKQVAKQPMAEQATAVKLVDELLATETPASVVTTPHSITSTATESTSLSDPQSMSDTGSCASEFQPWDRKQYSTLTAPIESSNNQAPTPVAPLLIVGDGHVVSNTDIDITSLHRSSSPLPLTPAANPSLSNGQHDIVTLPTYGGSKSFDGIMQELTFIREEAREQRARTDQLLTLLHNEAMQRQEAEKRLAEMALEMQDQQIKALRKDLEAKRSEALTMMYKAQAEMQEASVIASEAREQRAKAMEESAKAQVEILILQKKIQEMGHGSNNSNNTFPTMEMTAAVAAIGDNDRYGTLSVVSPDRFTPVERDDDTTCRVINSPQVGFNSIPISANATMAANGDVPLATTAYKGMTPESEVSDKEEYTGHVQFLRKHARAIQST
ncbi:hypothetical protein BGX27_010237 [Mortierella sp. AM989]|nr:hypothetical protein BGX27_010237 [Mortierella sp. AM989]